MHFYLIKKPEKKKKKNLTISLSHQHVVFFVALCMGSSDPAKAQNGKRFWNLRRHDGRGLGL